MILTVISSFADILGNPQEPNLISNKDSQLLFGETFDMEESHGAYVKGKSTLDNYIGYVERGQLIKDGPEANAIISVPLTHLYPEASLKSRPLMSLSFFSKISLNGKTNGEFSQTNNGNWVYSAHTQKLDAIDKNKELVEIALTFLGTPYRYGGRTSLGIDCSALLQLSLLGIGAECPPRDTKEQQTSIGIEILPEDIKRNDIVFFDGHVGIMVDEENIVNATARHMTTLVEPLSDLEKSYGEITAIRRV